MNEAELAGLAARALAAFGVGPREAGDAARILVLGDLFGHHTHGVARLEGYGERLRVGGINARARIGVEAAAPGLVKVDGDDGLGAAVGMRALEAATEAARATTLIAMSRMTGCAPGRGTPIASGLLPTRVSRPPLGAMVGVAVLPTMLA